MKTLSGYKSLLLGSGLLFIGLVGLRLSQSGCLETAGAAQARKHQPHAKCTIHPGGGSCVKDIAEKLFPVLKSLNLM